MVTLSVAIVKAVAMAVAIAIGVAATVAVVVVFPSQLTQVQVPAGQPWGVVGLHRVQVLEVDLASTAANFFSAFMLREK